MVRELLLYFSVQSAEVNYKSLFNMAKKILCSALIFILLCGYVCPQTQNMIDPYWTYFIDIYSGQHDVRSPSANIILTAGTSNNSLSRQNRRYPITGTFANGTSITRNGGFAFQGVPKMILSLQGVNQAAPADGNTDYGFSCTFQSITTTNFVTTH
jgi:hypothetical protein